MKENAYKTSRSLCFLALLFVCILNNHRAIAAPRPILREAIYAEEYDLDTPSQILVERLKKMVDRKQDKIEKEIEEVVEEEMEIESFIEAHTKQLDQLDQQQVYLEEELPPSATALSRGELSHPAEKRNCLTPGSKESKKIYEDVFAYCKTAENFAHCFFKYIALCHFKICNMGRKRQKRSEEYVGKRYYLH